MGLVFSLWRRLFDSKEYKICIVGIVVTELLLRNGNTMTDYVTCRPLSLGFDGLCWGSGRAASQSGPD